MNHYAYLLTFTNGMRYVGARSTHLAPELDASYLGSGRALPKDRKDTKNVIKKILATFLTREELMEYEENFIKLNDCTNSKDWYNQRVASFDRHGSIPWNIGLSATVADSFSETYSKRYKGNRSPAMIESHKLTAEKNRGVKNPAKGHKSTTNCAFTPWYYITPSEEYVEMTTVTKREAAKSLGVTERQLIHRFNHKNEHKKARYPTLFGYVFGNLPRPTESAEA